MDNGVHLDWLINPQQQHVEVYRVGESVEVLRSPTLLSGENVLPGFELNLDKVWA
jgi:Uma2 family endonuclease